MELRRGSATFGPGLNDEVAKETHESGAFAINTPARNRHFNSHHQVVSGR
jgi:hypothetical protein